MNFTLELYRFDNGEVELVMALRHSTLLQETNKLAGYFCETKKETNFSDMLK